MDPFKAANMLIMAAMETALAPAAPMNTPHHFARHARIGGHLARPTIRENRRHWPINKCNYPQRPAHQRARQVALRVAHLGGHHGDVIPAVVGPQGRRQRGEKPGCGQPAAARPGGRGPMGAAEAQSSTMIPAMNATAKTVFLRGNVRIER